MPVKRAIAIVCCALGSLAQAGACEIPPGWQPMTGSAGSAGTAAVEPITEPVKVGRKLDLAVVVCPPPGIEDVRVTVDATMPAHRHGMNYRPVVTPGTEGRIDASGLLFHMPGTWRLIVDAYADGWSRRFSLDLKAQ